MASEEDKPVFQPIRRENILTGQGEHPGYPEEDIEQPISHVNGDGEHPGYPEDEIERPETSHHDSSTDVDEKLERVETTKSMRDRKEFEPVTPRDRAELHRIASTFSGRHALSRTNTALSAPLERPDTLAGVNIGDPVLDPGSPEFDVYKWSRMFVLCALLHKPGIADSEIQVNATDGQKQCGSTQSRYCMEEPASLWIWICDQSSEKCRVSPSRPSTLQ